MKRFSFAIGMACTLVMATTIWAQTASVSTQSSGSVQAGRANASAETKQDANVTAGRKGATAAAQSQDKTSATAGKNSLELEEGTQIQAMLKSTLDSKQAADGQQFLLKTTRDVKANGRSVIKKGSTLVGHVVQAQGKAEGNGRSEMTLMIDALQQGDQQIPLQAVFVGMIQQTVQSAGEADLGSSPSPMTAPAQRSGGGLLGGGGVLGGATSTVNSTLGATTQTVANVGSSTLGTNGTLTHTTQGTLANQGSGVLGEPGQVLFSLQNGLTATVSGTASGATNFTRTGKDVKLEKGTEFLLTITGSSRVTTTSR